MGILTKKVQKRNRCGKKGIRSPWVWIMVLALILVLIIFLLSVLSPEGMLPLPLENTEDISKEPAQFCYDYVEVPGFKTKLTVTDDVPGIALKNPGSNSWYLYYRVLSEGTAVCTTRLIAPGQQYDFHVKGSLPSGSYTLTIEIYTATEQGVSNGWPISTQTIEVEVM